MAQISPRKLNKQINKGTHENAHTAIYTIYQTCICVHQKKTANTYANKKKVFVDR